MKATLRNNIESRIAAMTPRERAQESKKICHILRKRIPERVIVCGYMPLQTEVDIRTFLEDCLKREQIVCLPRYEDGQVTFYRISDLQTLTRGRYDIPVPPREAQALEEWQAAVVLVPGRAFDLHGNRLGRGGGGYDRWIARQRKANPDTQFLGVAFTCQLVDEVPTEPHDQKVDEVMTAKGQ